MGNYETYDVLYEATEPVPEGKTREEVKNELDEELSKWLWDEVEQAKKQATRGGK